MGVAAPSICWLRPAVRDRGSGQKVGELPAFGEGQGCQEAALLIVQDPHGRGLGGVAGVGWVDQEHPPVAGMALPCPVALVLRPIGLPGWCQATDPGRRPEFTPMA